MRTSAAYSIGVSITQPFPPPTTPTCGSASNVTSTQESNACTGCGSAHAYTGRNRSEAPSSQSVNVIVNVRTPIGSSRRWYTISVQVAGSVKRDTGTRHQRSLVGSGR